MRRSLFAIVTVSLTALLGCSDNANSTAASSSTSGSASSSSTSSGSGSSSGGGGSAGKETLVGITLDDVSDLPAITQSLKSLTIRPTARIVFDEFIPATNYLDAVTTIHPSSDIMGEILDSYYVALYTPDDYSARTTEYVDLLGTNVDIWEIGNEINGEWLCDQNASSCTDQQTADVVAKMTAGYDIVKAHGRPTALTLYYNENCYSDAKNEVFTWTAANVPEKLKQGLDYVLLSY